MAKRQVGVANSPTITAAAIVNFKKETCQVLGSGAGGLRGVQGVQVQRSGMRKKKRWSRE